MKKFIEAFKNKEVSSQSVSLPFALMSKVIASNPRIVIGVRHIQHAAGLSMWPVFYVSKDLVKRKKNLNRKNNRKMKCVKIFSRSVTTTTRATALR